MDKAITAKDYAKREHHLDVYTRIKNLAYNHGLKFVDSKPTGQPVYARLDHGRWIADCECKGAEAVDPGEPIFFCCSCGNISTGGKPRAVVFPAELALIEKTYMKHQDKRFQNWRSGEKVE